MENTLITLAIPVVKYNFLAEAIESCINQSYKNVEIIILNNANDSITKEKIKEIVNEYTDVRIKYYSNDKQLPMIENWNKLIHYSTGKFFALLCDDDKWDIKFIEKLFLLSQKYPNTNIFHSRLIIRNSNNDVTSISPLCNEFEDGLDFIYHRIKGWRQQFLSDFMVNTTKLREIGGFVYLPDGWGSDDITWFKIALSGGVAYNSEILFTYRAHNDNISNKNSKRGKIKSLELYLENVINILDKHNYESKINSYKRILIKKSLPEYYNKNYLNIISISTKKNIILKMFNYLKIEYHKIKLKITR